MSNINVSFKNLEINVLDDEGVNIFAYTVPEYQLSMNAKGMVRFMGELVKAVEITNTWPDEEPPKMNEIYYIVSENGIDTEQWGSAALDDRNWKSGRATKDINKATEMFKSLCVPS